MAGKKKWDEIEVKKLIGQAKTSEEIMEKTGIKRNNLLKIIVQWELENEKVAECKKDILAPKNKPYIADNSQIVISKGFIDWNEFKKGDIFNISSQKGKLILTRI